MDTPAYTDRQKQILRQLKMYYEVTPQRVRFDEHDRIIADGFVELLMGTRQLQVEFSEVNSSFSAVGKGLVTLLGAPEKVEGYFDVASNKLETLRGGPKWVGGDFICWKNQLSSLEAAPEHVGGAFIIYANPLVSLEGMPQKIGVKLALSYDPELPLLRTLVAPHIELSTGPKVVSWDRLLLCEEILNKYAGQGRAGAIDCKRALVAAGFEGNARW